MTLKQFLEYYPDQKFEIGTYKGSGFLYVGSPGKQFNEFCNSYFNARQDHLSKLIDKVQFMSKYDENYSSVHSELNKAINYIKTYVDFRDREVVSATRSIIDRAYIVVTVEGKEAGQFDGLELPKLSTHDKINLDGCFKLLERVYADAAEEFQYAYKAYLAHPSDQKYESAVVAASTFFRNSPLVDFSGASGEEVLRTLKHKLQQERKAIKSIPPDVAINAKIKEKGLSKSDVADMCGIGRSSIFKWCSGNFPKQMTDSMIKVCRYLGCEESVTLFYNQKLAQAKQREAEISRRQSDKAKQLKSKTRSVMKR